MTWQALCEHLSGFLYRTTAHKVEPCEPGSSEGGSIDLLVISLIHEMFSGQSRNNENKFSSMKNPVGRDASKIFSGPGV